ncbi:4'-phosphopantetheinyl transferase family protein [Anaerotignum neopropionicum]|nr:4'-phosphopantetheinyl transferase superfamily protein [Anaerotignum neopropionicum]
MELLIMDADELQNHEKFQKAMELVGAERRNKVEKLLKAERKRLSLAAGLLLKYAFFSAGHSDLYEEIQITEHGKPYLPRHEFYFSLSHSGRFAICGFSDNPIGCDIEKAREKLPRTEKIFSPDEANIFGKLEDDKKISFFFHLWTCKESVAKWIGKGIAYPFESFSVMGGEQVNHSVFINETELFLKSFYKENYTISLCAQSAEFPKEMQKLDWNILMNH